MKDRLETIIRDWFNTEFNNPDVLPNVVISGLAEEIDKHRWEIFNAVQEEYDREDIYTLSAADNITLTNDEVNAVLERYRNVDYRDMDTLSSIIDNVVSWREDMK